MNLSLKYCFNFRTSHAYILANEILLNNKHYTWSVHTTSWVSLKIFRMSGKNHTIYLGMYYFWYVDIEKENITQTVTIEYTYQPEARNCQSLEETLLRTWKRKQIVGLLQFLNSSFPPRMKLVSVQDNGFY